MPRTPIGDVAMTATERSQRRRLKALQSRVDVMVSKAEDAETQPADRLGAIVGPPAGKPGADYPRMLYHPDGHTIIVATPEQHHELAADDWVIAPLAVHRQRPVSSYGVLGATSDPMIEVMRQVIREEVRSVLKKEFDLHDLSGTD